MRTNIDIDDELMAEAMKATGLTTKKETVEEALRQLVQGHKRLRGIYEIRGTGWTGDLDRMRESWGFREE